MTAGVRPRLPVWAVVTRSYAYVWERRELLALPLLLLFAVRLAASIYIQRADLGAPDASPDARLLAFVINILVTLVSMSAAVGLHRTVLLNEIRRGIAFFRWDGNLLRYIGTGLLLAVIGVLLAIIFILVVTILGMAAGLVSAPERRGILAFFSSIAAILVLGALFLRFMLALPAAALGVEKDRLGTSWRATFGNWLRLFAVAFLTALPLIVLNLLLAIPAMREASHALASGQTPAPMRQPIALLVLFAAVGVANVAVLTVMLSLCYDVLERGGGPAYGPVSHRGDSGMVP